MKKFLALLLLVVVMLFCVACNSEGRVTPEVEEAIKQTYINTIENSKYLKVEELSLEHYGCYDGAYVFDAGRSMDFGWSQPQWIGGMTFNFGSGQVLHVYKDGEIKVLREAYSDGWLSNESLADLHKYFS